MSASEAPWRAPPGPRRLRGRQGGGITRTPTPARDEQPEQPSPIVAITSRPPVVQRGGTWVSGTGGLAPIVRSVMDERGGSWVCWNGAAAAPPRSLDGSGFELLTFSLTPRCGEDFYDGYATRTLWPLLHDSIVPATFDPSWWAAYRSANDVYARAAQLALARTSSTEAVWVHDYHLMLVPSRLRELGVDSPVAFFLHTPFPTAEVLARLPQRQVILDGLSGATRIGVHTRGDARRLADSWNAFGRGDQPETSVIPASVSVEEITDAARVALGPAKALRRQLGDRVVLLGIERLDYTKGIPERLRALEHLLSRRTDLQSRVTYVQVASASRGGVPEYQRLRELVEREIGRLNGRFTVPGGPVPVRYLSQALPWTELVAYYLAADVALVTPLRDGMNLVAKEYVVAKHAAGLPGVLVLSEFAGAADELTEAVLCNPFDIDGTAAAIEEAIEMGLEEQHARVAAMAATVAAHPVGRWADLQLARPATAVAATEHHGRSPGRTATLSHT